MRSNTQKIFKASLEAKLREDLKGGGHAAYYKSAFEPAADDLLPSDIIPSTPLPVLSPDVSKEAENAVLLHRYFSHLDETQASDKRLWAYLSHVDFRDYVMKRWKLPSLEEVKKDEVKRNICTSSIMSHWFIGNENDRSLRRHALARLWWAAHLTRAPWKKDPEYFGHLHNENEYLYTPVLFINENVYSELLERRLGRFSHILITILEFLRQHPEFADRSFFRPLSKELVLQSGYRRITLLPYKELYSLIEEIAQDVKANPDQSQSIV